MESTHITGRIPRSCTECARRKIKCDHRHPCGACTRRGQAALCVPPDLGPQVIRHSVHDEQDKVALQRRIAMLEARLRDSSSTRQSNDAGTNPEGLLVMLENISLGQPASTTTFDRIVTPLYQIGRPVFLMLIPDRDSSHRIVDFALENLTWLHCAVRTHVFQQEHFRFWESIEAGSESSFESDHGWLSVYFSLLAAGYLYMDPECRPMLPRFNGLVYTPDKIERDNNVSRIWYEAAVKELEASSPLTRASLRTVQTVAILTLIHNHFGETEQEYILLGMAINTARALDMHLLGSEDHFSRRLASQHIWSTPQDRQFGRRLWWTLVINDWLGMFTHPSSISPSSFNTVLSPQTSDIEDLLMGRTECQFTSTSPLQHHLTMSELANVIYTQIKAPRDPNTCRFSQVSDRLEALGDALPRRKSPSPTFPDWVAMQEYLFRHTIQYISVTIARASLVLWLMEKPDTESIINKGVSSALEIISIRRRPMPRLYQYHWVVSAATLAAGVFLAVHLICFKGTLTFIEMSERRDSIRFCLEAIRYPNHTTSMATHGAQALEILLQIEARSPVIDDTGKGMLIHILKMAFQGNGSNEDPLISHGTITPTSLDPSLSGVDLSWPSMVNDLGLDELLPDLDWGLVDPHVHWQM